MKPIVIIGGRVIDPIRGVDGVCDLTLIDGRIASLDTGGGAGRPEDATIIDAKGWWVVPGLVDPHVHLRDPGFPNKETIASGLRAAAAGGFTAVAAMANTLPVNDRPEITAYMLERARATSAARLIPVAAVSKRLEGREAVDYEAMAAASARLFSDDGIPIDDQKLLASAIRRIGALGLAVSLHEEDRELSRDNTVNAGSISKSLGVPGIPNTAESARVGRDLAIAIASGAPVHVAHVSTGESIELIRAARKDGACVTCEVAPHHFALSDETVTRCGPNAKMNPPLRAREDVDHIRSAIADGTIDMIATDHAPHDPESKRIAELAPCFPRPGAPKLPPAEAEALRSAANGIVGLETALGLALELVHGGLISPSRLVAMMASNPARLLRIEAGDLMNGKAADVTIIDPERRWIVDPAKFLSLSRNTPFAGMKLRGKTMVTIVGGQIVYDGRTGDAHE